MHAHIAIVALGLLTPFSSASTITAKAIPPLLRRQNTNPACSGFSSLESSCSIKISDFTNLDFTEQASCLCSQSSTYDGSVYDGYFKTCLAYYSTASPSFYSSELSGDALPASPCSFVAAITGIGVSTLSDSILTVSAGRQPTATTSFDANGAACTSWDQIQEECSQRTSGFGNLPFSSEASCLCYTGSTWAPQKYDGYWGSCLAFFKTANPTLYATWQSANATNPTPCASVGNVRNGPTLTVVATTTGNSTSARSSSSSRASSGVVSTSGASSSSSRSTITSSAPTVLTTAGTATSTRSSSAGSTYKSAALGWLVPLMGCVTFVMLL